MHYSNCIFRLPKRLSEGGSDGQLVWTMDSDFLGIPNNLTPALIPVTTL